MKNRFFTKSRPATRLLAIAVICSMLPYGAAWGVNQPPLSRVTNPVFVNPPDGTLNGTLAAPLKVFIKDSDAAIRLGKALFWDMQVGSDGQTACATCHYRAGADPVTGVAPVLDARRDKNQLHPGPDALFGNTATGVNTAAVDGFGNPVLDGLGNPVPFTITATGLPQFKPNYTLLPADFPLFLLNPGFARLVIDPLTGLTNDPVTSIRDTNDVVGSQGIRLAQFAGIDPNANSAVDISTPLTDQLFHIGAAAPTNNIRQVTGRNTPPVVNAVFNFTNFWDGRANNIFNGSTPFGPLDQSARVWVNTTGTPGAQPVQQQISIPNASLASQAVGPPLSPVEMSFSGRTFPELGQKMLARAPLANQFVHPQDSVLGPFSNAQLQAGGTLTGNRGLNIPGNTYRGMVEAAFVDNLWNGASPPGGFTQIQANFALFWGLAIQLYEATLVSDRAPFDLFQQGNQNAMSFAAQQGFGTFDSKCTICHTGSEFSSAVVGSNLPGCAAPDCNPPAFTDNATHGLIRNGLQSANIFPLPGIVTFDEGFFNIGVRPTAEDIGRGGTAPSGLPLSFTLLAKEAGLPFATPQLPPFASATDTVQGAFKTPGLRNVELTAPYFHNGFALTLDQVVEFYARGGNFPGNPELAANMQAIGNLRGDAVRRSEVVAFLKALTDERVRQEKAPFDHPELVIPNGATDPGAADVPITLQPTGGAFDPVAPGLTLNPPITPTILTSQAIGGTIADAVKATTVVAVSVNGGPAAAATVICTPDPLGLTCTPTNTWNFTIAGLTVGDNNIVATATDVTANGTGQGVETASATIVLLPTAILSNTPQVVTRQTSANFTVGGAGVDSYQYKVDGGPLITTDPIDGTPLTINKPIALGGLADGTHTVTVLGKNTPLSLLQPEANATTFNWTIKANPPVLTLTPVTGTVRGKSLTIDGTTDLGLIPVVRADTAVTIGPVTNVSGNWSCQVSGLKSGVTNFTVTATDIALNATVATTGIKISLPDGNIKGTGSADMSDAVKALRIAVGLAAPSTDDMLRGDVAPLVDGVPVPDDKIDLTDALVILRKVVGLIDF